MVQLPLVKSSVEGIVNILDCDPVVV